MSKIKPGDRVRVARDLFLELNQSFDLTGMEGTVVSMTPSLGWTPDAPGVGSESTWVRVNLAGRYEIFRPDELEVIEP